MKVNHSIIRIVGLLGEFKNQNKQNKDFLKSYTDLGYVQENSQNENENSVKDRKQFLRDYFYPDFRNIMFLGDKAYGSVRMISTVEKKVALGYGHEENRVFYDLKVIKSEIYFFTDQIGLFSLSLQPAKDDYDLSALSNILSIVRSFDTPLQDKSTWIEWISKNYLLGEKLRGDGVMVDEYSGSKFKLFTVIDADFTNENRTALLYDLATTSRLGSGLGIGDYAPDQNYVKKIMENRIAVFNNWEALCLFDGFCCVGTNQLLVTKDIDRFITWDYTYFRIYLYRLFFKYNLYRYNSVIHNDSEETVKYRNQFEDFLNKYNLSHISFNFLANEIFHKTGEALELEKELTIFRNRINNLSSAIQEERQAKTNFLLQAVTVLSGIASVGPVLDILKEFEKWMGWTDPVFYTVLVVLILIIGGAVLYYLMPKKVKKWTGKIFGSK